MNDQKEDKFIGTPEEGQAVFSALDRALGATPSPTAEPEKSKQNQVGRPRNAPAEGTDMKSIRAKYRKRG